MKTFRISYFVNNVQKYVYVDALDIDTAKNVFWIDHPFQDIFRVKPL